MTRTGLGRWAAILLALLLTLSINYHAFWPDFHVLPGDRGDTRLMVFTLEHWVKVFRGHEAFYVLNMFYPDKVALGYADGLFLFSLPYASFRALGADPFTSYQLFLIFMTAFGYAGCLWLLRRALGLGLGFSILGSVLLTSLNSMQFQADIGKLVGFYFYPLLIGLLYGYFTAKDKNSLKAWFGLLSFAGLLGLLFFTSYYPAWFFAFTLLLFALISLVYSAIRQGAVQVARRMAAFFWRQKMQIVAALMLLAISLVPFATTYAPLVRSDASRSFGLVLDFSPRVKDLINVSQLNVVWSPVLSSLHFNFGNREVQMGSPFLGLSLFIGFCVYGLFSLMRRQGRLDRTRDHVVIVLAATAFAILALTVKFHNLSFWHIVYQLVPGASALRALGRYLMIFDVIVVVTVVYGLNAIYEANRARFASRPFYLLGGAIILAAALIAEQLNSVAFRLDKADQLTWLSRYNSPTSACKAFFVNDADSNGLPVGYYQLDAMMISMKTGIPTVNGYSGITPNEAFSIRPTGVEYTYKILKWLDMNDARDGICELDLQSALYRPVDVATEYRMYRDLFRASYVEAFSTLHASARKFLADGNALSDLYPRFLEEHGYLPATFEYQEGPTYKWMQDRYWIGERRCGGDKCFGIGIVGTYADIKAIIAQYRGEAWGVFFPSPESWMPGKPIGDEIQGELLMVFPVTNSQP